MEENLSRRKFTKIHEAIALPDLIEIQKKSYQWLFKEGLKDLFQEISPIKDFTGRDLELYFSDYYLDEPKFSETEAKNRNVTYEAALRVKTKLVNKKTGEVKEQEVYLGDFPLMTKRASFIINGIERVVISQLTRSTGVFFTGQEVKGRRNYGAKLIPNKGAWIEIETDSEKVIWVRIDRKRKIAITSLLKAFGYGSNEELLNLFYQAFKKLSAKEDFGAEKSEEALEYIKSTLKKDLTKSEAEALIEIYKRIKPGDLAAVDNAKNLIYGMFFNPERYDLGKVGRYKMNQRLGLNFQDTLSHRVLQKEDFIAVVRELIYLNVTQKEADDIDHLSNRRIRSVGELVQNVLRIGLLRLQRIIRDKMSTINIENVTPNQLINPRPVIGAVRDFFMSSQLSQFMEQTNPLAELEHKRKFTVAGPGGLTKERAGFEVRDVHRTFYGRICPIQTPEGPTIGLVGYLSCYARLNEFGFIETPYLKVVREGNKSRVTKEIVYLNASEDEKYIITPATTPLDEKGCFIKNRAEARVYGSPSFCDVKEIDFMDVSPKQIISVATSLIPFLEHNDSGRALMGSNMQRQAVPCIKPSAPLVGTGLEKKAALDSGYLIIAPEDGEIIKLDAKELQFKISNGDVISYPLEKFVRSNFSTCINQRVKVDIGDKIKKGDIMVDGPSIDSGELSLGQNLLVAFMSWEGWNYEDAIIISDKLIKDDCFTSIHIENYTLEVRETKLGPEVVTRDIPNVSEEKLKNLDEEGIVRIGAEVSSGDILVGKITPKGETELSAEEKLLRAIFGEKAKDVKDSSLYLEHGERGKVIGVKIFSREKGDKLSAGVIKSIEVMVADLRKIQVGDKMAGRHGNKGVISKIVPQEDMPYLADGTAVDIILNPLGVASRMNLGQILETHLGLVAKTLDYKVSTPPLCGIGEEIIKNELEKAGFNRSGKMKLFNGKTGEPFIEEVTVGYIYMMKLNHMVEDKIHQRSIGPYSLITQQPLGGKAQSGGQRFGEMEVWALEAYGAAHILQEMLTIKSDDVSGRLKTYESIIKDEPIEQISTPESFNVLIRELKGLCLDVDLLKSENDKNIKKPKIESKIHK